MPFETLIEDARGFLTELAGNNNREWFTAQKSRYDDQLKSPALALLDIVSADLQRMTGAPVTAKLFRPQRDVRFSKDKTPYHTHLHMMWTAGGVGAYFFGIDLDRTVAGGGAMGLEKDHLTAYRSRVDGAKGADLVRCLRDLDSQGFTIGEPELKRVPPPFAADHPRGEMLRRKSLSLWRPIPAESINLRNSLKGGFAALLPLQQWLAKLS